jgi:glycosyltransferase involved in cell wall biosynthesis
MPTGIDLLSAPRPEDDRHAPGDRPLLAYFSPLPPQRSGIADYSLSLLAELRCHYLIDLYHDEGYAPNLGPAARHFGCFDHRLFERRARVLPYHGILYHIGNSGHHDFLYDRLLAYPGVVTLHDFYLGALHVHRSRRPGSPPDYLETEVAYERGEAAGRSGAPLPPRGARPEALVPWPRAHGLWLNRRVLDRAAGVVVHSEWCVRQAAALAPVYADKMTVIPMGTAVREPDAAGRRAARMKFGLPADALLVGSFGILHPAKLNAETVEAFAPLAGACPSALLLFVGQDLGAGEVQARVARLGLGARVRVFGHRPAAEFRELLSAVDIGVTLRRPPTNGETSAALLQLLGAGVATVVTDVDTFACFSDEVVRKVPAGGALAEALARALLELGLDEGRRQRLARAALRHARARHTWDRVAARYAEFIDRCARPLGRAPRPTSRTEGNPAGRVR